MPEDDEGDANEDLDDEDGEEVPAADHGPPAERIAKVCNADAVVLIRLVPQVVGI